MFQDGMEAPKGERELETFTLARNRREYARVPLVGTTFSFARQPGTHTSRIIPLRPANLVSN